MKTFFFLIAVAAISCAAFATAPNDGEFALQKAWVDKYVNGKTAAAAEASKTVIDNYEGMALFLDNRGPGQGLLKLGNKEYPKGLGCHIYSKIKVKTGKKAAKFTAVVGLDDRVTGTDDGSVHPYIMVGNKVVWDGGVLRKSTKTFAEVSVDLGGATEFLLVGDDAGDGIGNDWLDWADPKVTLEDGTVLEVSDLPERTSVTESDNFFSFKFDDKDSADFLGDWKVKRSSKKQSDGSVKHTVTYTDPATKMEARADFIEYNDFPTVEWRMTFTNGGKTDSPMLSDVMPLNLTAAGTAGSGATLRHPAGSTSGRGDYEPFADDLAKRQTTNITATNGRPTEGYAPYFNIDFGTSGVIAALGWQGQWISRWTRTGTDCVTAVAGQEVLNTTLHPGESITTPRVVLQFWTGGDWIRAQNIWRRWMMAHNTPLPGGKHPVPTMEACSSHQYAEMQKTDTEKQIMFIDRYLEEKLPLDYWWMDAGWYTYFDQWFNTGSWIVDKKRFPKGLTEISDHAHERGVKTLLWFETECVTPDPEIANEHPEWVYGGDACRNFKPGGPRPWLLLKLGNPEAKKWIQTRIIDILNENHIDLYRQDFRLGPIYDWRREDEENRSGMNEIRHCEAYMDMWDAISAARPDAFIDSCAAGGRRNEIDAMKRAVPLLRSDHILDPIGNQSHTYGISFWLPYHGTGVKAEDAYGFRSTMCPMQNACYDMRDKNLDYDSIRKYFGQWKKVAPYMLCDYYPLTDYSYDNNCWIGWQYDSPEQGAGMVEMFRRENSPFTSGNFKLRGLDPAADYIVTDEDTGNRSKHSGKELSETGIEINLPDPTSCVLFTYKKVE